MAKRELDKIDLNKTAALSFIRDKGGGVTDTTDSLRPYMIEELKMVLRV